LKKKFYIKLNDYDSIPQITISDHKPVKAEFELLIQENTDDYFSRLIEDDRIVSDGIKKSSSSSVDSMQLYTCNIF
jgi:hypothetical protein